MTSLQKPPRLERPKDWIRYIRAKGDDRKWLADYEEHLVAVVRKGIYKEPDFADTVHLLKEILPYFLIILLHVERWSPILMDALIQSQSLQDNKLQIEILRFVGEANLQLGKHKSANTNFTIALERADDGEIPEMMVASYTGIFKLQWFDLKQPLSDDFVKKALEIARQVTDLDLLANLHLELARAYAHLATVEKALGHGQMAYIYWHRLQNNAELGRAAFILATVYRHTAFVENAPGCLKHAEYLMEIARQRMADTEHVWQYAQLAYESGVLCLQQNEAEQALSWFRVALDEARILDLPSYLAVAYHSMGLALTALERYSEARDNLKTAQKLWQGMDNTGEEVSLLQAFGYLEGRAGQPGLAHDYLNRALKLCESLPDSPQKETLRNHILASFNELV